MMQILAVFGILCVTLCQGAKILLVPVNVRSHVQYFSRLGAELVGEGHHSVIALPSNAKPPSWARDTDMEIWTYPAEGAVPFANSEANARILIKSALSDSSMDRMNLLLNFSMGMSAAWEGDCVRMMESDIPGKVKEGGFDLAIMDLAGIHCIYSLPYSLNLPYIHFAIYSSPWIYRVPGLPSFIPNMMAAAEGAEVMTFTERLSTLLTEGAGVLMANHSGTTLYARKYAPLKERDIFSMALGAEFFFYLDDVSLGYPKPLMPNTVAIGDVMGTPASPLPPGDLASFLQGARAGVVLVSFGSYLDFLPETILHEMCAAFSRIPQRVVWRLRSPDLCRSPNVMTLAWLPQSDLLGDPHVVAFVTHAGLNSLIEAVYHGVPVVAVPLALDQPYNTRLVTSRGAGVYLDIRDFTADDLEVKVRHVINDPTIRENIRKCSEILRNKPETAAKRASFWINHVLQYGSRHLRSGAFQLNMMQFYMFDIFLFLIVCFVLLFIFAIFFIYLCFKCCRRVCCRSALKASEKVKQN